MTSTDSVMIVSEEHPGLLDKLEDLLNRQISQARKGDFRASEVLSEQSGKIVDKLSRADVPQSVEFKEKFERLAKLYRQAILIVAAQKDRLEGQLQQTGRTRRTLRAYRGGG
ncbi:MAG: hypothetical protein AMJ65_00700 [Phycisphaerae bacterium SG8_4]|nr:MAG: hypothetical protein AMJ65_00700 [Phycisphaerae bacterium SG8_4]